MNLNRSISETISCEKMIKGGNDSCSNDVLLNRQFRILAAYKYVFIYAVNCPTFFWIHNI